MTDSGSGSAMGYSKARASRSATVSVSANYEDCCREGCHCHYRFRAVWQSERALASDRDSEWLSDLAWGPSQHQVKHRLVLYPESLDRQKSDRR